VERREGLYKHHGKVFLLVLPKKKGGVKRGRNQNHPQNREKTTKLSSIKMSLLQSSDEKIRQEIWNGVIPVSLSLTQNETATLQQPEQYYVGVFYFPHHRHPCSSLTMSYSLHSSWHPDVVISLCAQQRLENTFYLLPQYA
jgi:hypothetical protein